MVGDRITNSSGISTFLSSFMVRHAGSRPSLGGRDSRFVAMFFFLLADSNSEAPMKQNVCGVLPTRFHDHILREQESFAQIASYTRHIFGSIQCERDCVRMAEITSIRDRHN
jgi:hypothetical protein